MKSKSLLGQSWNKEISGIVQQRRIRNITKLKSRWKFRTNPLLVNPWLALGILTPNNTSKLMIRYPKWIRPYKTTSPKVTLISDLWAQENIKGRRSTTMTTFLNLLPLKRNTIKKVRRNFRGCVTSMTILIISKPKKEWSWIWKKGAQSSSRIGQQILVRRSCPWPFQR